MELSLFDVLVFVGFFAVVIGVSLFKSRKETSSEDYFLAGRGLKWWLIGVSIVAANISTEQFVGMAGQGAGDVGLAVSNWQLLGSIGIVVIAFTLIPRFLKAGIYTMPEYLEYRYNSAARGIMALLTVVVYVAVLLTAVLYSGGITLRTIFGLKLEYGVWLIGLLAAGYTVWGGLKAVAWADLFQGGALIVGGLVIFFLGLHACGGWEQFTEVNEDKLHMILPESHEKLPWTGLASGMWIVLIYYTGLNQFIVQRNLAAKTLRDGQLGVIFAGALWLIVPFAIVIPGIMSNQLYGDQMSTPDEAFPILIRNLVPAGLRGFMFAAISGAVISSLGSMLNSASTIFTMDVYKRMFGGKAGQKGLLLLGRSMTMIFVIVGCLLAPMLDNPKFGGVFQYIQQFQGYIWPGVVAAFLFGMLVPQAPAASGVVALVSGPIFYAIFQMFAKTQHFLVDVAISFNLVICIMGLMTFLRPLETPRKLPVREDIDLETKTDVKIYGILVIAAVIAFIVIFR
ncbi:SLC5 family protein [Sedimentisphaera salicampi]|uniref:Na(+)/glucose symporter n=1 Tax=Sedimentisphaera salicampi TaxID=1941349 RepID=A0A1W6LIN7_9BACT|nr:sodium/solute symporter [Sedimentisphaera salicampi]ARN55658.1 Na(+)/glucose symporter [Sedimentisphaera salicampi]OXU16177.1 Na(+)/glucose symporter [Sedimentisphaera salicampi]